MNGMSFVVGGKGAAVEIHLHRRLSYFLFRYYCTAINVPLGLNAFHLSSLE